MPILAAISVLTIAAAALLIMEATPTSRVEAATSTFSAVADAAVYENNPGGNYGSSDKLRVDGSPAVRSYLRFEVSGASGSVTKATLQLWATSSSSTGYEARTVSGPWAEDTVTFSNSPAVGALLSASGGFSAGQWISVDVTGAVSGNGTVNLAVTGPGATAIAFSSKEGGNAPRLVVETSGSSGSTPTPTPTPTTDPGGEPYTGSFDAVADAAVYQTSPDRNYGRSKTIRIDGEPVIRSYVRFDLSGLSGTVTKATLRIWANSASSAGYEARRISGSWTETGVTYNNAPTVGSLLGSSGSFASGGWVSVDVTSLVSGNGTVDLAVTGINQTAVSLGSREGGNAPQLVVETNGTGDPGPTPTPTPDPGSDYQPSFPIRAAFYYPWFPETWDDLDDPFTVYTPSLGWYDSSDPAVIKKHIASMQYGKVEAGIASWWGQGSRTDGRISELLAGAAGTTFRWTLYHENESKGDPSASQIRNDLEYIRDRYASDPSYLKVNGRFVVFVYAASNDACGMADRWKQANSTVNAYIVLKVFSGYEDCASQPDAWHQYGPAKDASSHRDSYTISPGFWKDGESGPRLERNIDRWRQNIRDMVASGKPWQLVTTFNEWGEGTAVESAEEWKTSSGHGAYLDALRNDGGSGSSPTPTPTPQPDPGGQAVLVGAGDIASCSSSGDEATAKLLDNIAGTVFVAGDAVYESGTHSEFANCYDPTWGRHKSRTRPAAGNHEYLTADAAGYFDYFGALAGEKGKGWYSYDLGSWHVVVLNSNCSKVGGCGPGSPQYTWLENDLKANSGKTCTVAYFHHPLFTAGPHDPATDRVKDFWELLYDYNADVVISGHDHNYQRWKPQTPDGAADSSRGIRQFVVGTGGKNTTQQTRSPSNMEVGEDDTDGVLKLTLGSGSYTWEFVPVAGESFSDKGTGSCH